MSSREPARTRTGGYTIVVGLLLLVATIVAAPGLRSLASPSSTADTAIGAASDEEGGSPVGSGQHGAVPTPLAPPLRALPSSSAGDARSDREARHGPPPPSRGEGHGALVSPGTRAVGPESRGGVAAADGAVPAATTVFDDDVPGVGNLDRSLLAALRRAAADAADDGVEFFVNSGWRSPEYQEQLLLEAVSRYGSASEAARWVATPGTSAHVSGDAVDLGFAATAWLSRHGAEYGLCQIYRNELWHYELRSEAKDKGCPPMYADPTHDPRMRQ